MSSKTASKLARVGQKYNPVDPAKRGKPNRKAAAKLALRLKGYKETIERPENRGKDMSGYHIPGSRQR